MGSIKQGLLGGVSGKVGNIVGYRRKGKDLVRVQAASISDAKTPKQLKQRQKVATVMEFLKPILPFIRIGYKNYAQGRTAYNTATSFLLKRCLTENEKGEAEINYRRVMVSIGFLLPAMDATATYSEHRMTFAWTDNSGTGNAESTDTAMLLVHNKEKGANVYHTNAALRSDSTATLALPKDWEGDTLVAYLSFVSADGEEVSNSVPLL